MQKEPTLFSLVIEVPFGVLPPSGLAKKWGIACKKAAGKTNLRRRAVVGTEEDFRQKIAEPAIKHFSGKDNVDFLDYFGLDVSVVLDKHRIKLLNSAGKYFRKLDNVYRTINKTPALLYKKRVDQAAEKYLRRISRFYPLIWSRYPKKSVVELALMGLGGGRKIQGRYIKETDRMSGSAVVISNPERAGRFRQALNNLIIKTGSEILMWLELLDKIDARISGLPVSEANKLEYLRSQAGAELNNSVSTANRLLNELAEQYRLPDYAPFAADGGSHINFVSENKYDYKQRKYIRRLFLEISVVKYE